MFFITAIVSVSLVGRKWGSWNLLMLMPTTVLLLDISYMKSLTNVSRYCWEDWRYFHGTLISPTILEASITRQEGTSQQSTTCSRLLNWLLTTSMPRAYWTKHSKNLSKKQKISTFEKNLEAFYKNDSWDWFLHVKTILNSNFNTI